MKDDNLRSLIFFDKYIKKFINIRGAFYFIFFINVFVKVKEALSRGSSRQ